MKKSLSKKTILKEAGVLLIAAILVLTVLTSVVVTPMKAAQTADHDVGVTAIVSPTTGSMPSYPVEVTVKNFGTNDEYSVPVEVVIEKNGVQEYDQTVTIDIAAGASMNVFLPDWYPSDIGEYQVTACTQLVGDQNPSNDCFTETFYITMDFMGLGVAPLGQATLAIVDGNLTVSNMGSSGNDGVWINLENTHNLFHCEMVYPDPTNSLPLGAGMKRVLTGTINGEPDQLINSNDMIKVDDNIWNSYFSIPSSTTSCTLEAFLNHNLVYYSEFNASGSWGCSNNISSDDTQLSFSWVEIPGTYDFLQMDTFIPWQSAFWPDETAVYNDLFQLHFPWEYKSTTEFSSTALYANDIPTITITEITSGQNNPPNTPTISGTPIGKVGAEYKYKLAATDPDNESVYYFVDWGDGSNMSFYGPYSSGAQATVSHTWAKKGTYTIRTKAMDPKYFESDWATLQVKMPRMYTYTPLILRLLERFPNAFPILRNLMGL